jgi:hypothetical protein
MYSQGFGAWKLSYVSSGAVIILIPMIVMLALVGKTIIKFEGGN